MLEPLLLQWLKLHAFSLFANDVYSRALQLLTELEHVSHLVTFGAGGGGGRGDQIDGKEVWQHASTTATDAGRERALAHKANATTVSALRTCSACCLYQYADTC